MGSARSGPSAPQGKDSFGGRELLRIIDAIVTADRGASRCRGRLGIGVGAKNAESWLLVQLGDGVSTELVDSMPTDVDVLVALGEREARAVMGLCQMPKDPVFALWGDAALFRSFVAGYIRRHDLFTVRQRSKGRG